MLSTRRFLCCLALVCLAPACGGGGNGGGAAPGDTTAPNAIADLAAPSSTSTTVNLTWTAPGDDGATGTAASYELRFAAAPLLTLGDWNAATVVPGLPAPAASGTPEVFIVGGLASGTTYSFAIRATDDAANSGALSNSPSRSTVDITAPAAVVELTAATSTSTSVNLTWTAPGDDNNSGTATSYAIRYAGAAITTIGAWNAATPVAGVPAPAPAGSPETFNVTGLTPNSTYFFAIRATDEAANTGALSNSPSRATTMIPPGSLAALTLSPTQIDLHWLDLSSTESGYLIERSLDGVVFNSVTTLPPNAEYYPDSSRSPSTAYYYRVSTLHATGLPGISPIASDTTLPATGGWRMQSRDQAHTNYPTAETGVPPLSPAWAVTPGPAGYFAHPAVVESGRVFLTHYSMFSAQTRVYARSLASGAPAWNFDYGNVDKLGNPSVYQGRVYVPVCNSNSSFLSVSDAATGSPLYTAAFPSQFQTLWAPTILGRRVYLNAGTFGGLYAWDGPNPSLTLFANTGLDQSDSWSPLYVDGKVYSYTGSNFRAHHPTTGATLWTLPIPRKPGYTQNTSPVAGNGLIYVVAEPDLAAVNPVTQSLAWFVTGFDYTGSPAYADGVLYVIQDGSLHARDAATGAYLWNFLGDRNLSYPPVVVNNHVYVASDANVYAVNLGTRSQVWTDAYGGWITASDGYLLLARSNGELRAYTFGAGTRPSEIAAPAAPTGLVATPGVFRNDLSWTAPPSGVMGYRIERSPDNAAWSILHAQGYGTTTFTDVGLDPGVTWYYRVLAINAAGSSAPSAMASAAALGTTSSWPTFAANPAHTGDVVEVFAPPANFSWSVQVAPLSVPLHAVAVENYKVFATAPYPHKTLIALTGVGGAAWSYDFGSLVDLGPPTVYHGRVMVPARFSVGGDGDPKLFCFDAETGRPLWTGLYDCQTSGMYAPIVVGNTVYLSQGTNNGIAAFRLTDGQRLYQGVGITGVDRWTPAFAGGTLYSLVLGTFRAHTPATGATVWSITLPNGGDSSANGTVAAVGATHAYFTTNLDLRAVNLTTQLNEWSVTAGPSPSNTYFGTPALSGGKLFVYKGNMVSGGALEVRDAAGLGSL
ncbi:MAG: PQQ-binding-like beta-propeller repeat protein, partial [Planctomycetes bacterium]|nr:PQQ-binding-like beta-propeller repeat protein [Planctomycetota bacterium]